MSVRPPESPINISSASPTPTRPTLSLPRRSSSRLRDQPLPELPTRRPPVEEMEMPPFRRNGQPYVMMPSSSTSRARPTGLALPGPSRPRPMARDERVIDLTEDDEDDVEFTGSSGLAPVPPPARPRRELPAPFPGDMDRLDRIVDDRRRATRAIIDGPRGIPDRQSSEPFAGPANPLRARLAYLAPGRRARDGDEQADLYPPPFPGPDIADRDQPPPPRRLIGLGGAVLRRGNHRINYTQPGPSGRVRPQTGPRPLPDVEEDRVRTRAAERVEQARRVMPMRDEGMIAGMIDNIMNGMGAGFGGEGLWGQGAMVGGYPGMEDLLRRLRPAGNPLLNRHPYGHGPGLPEDIQVITARAHKPIIKPAKDGFTRNFAIDETIEIDQPRSEKRYLSCTTCGEPLLLSDGQKSPNDKIWSLRCGHFVHQKCLHEFSEPQLEQDRNNITRPLQVLGAEENKRGKRQRTKKSGRKTNEPVEYDWKCPVKGCGLGHVSLLKDAEWVQDEVEGAFQIYV